MSALRRGLNHIERALDRSSLHAPVTEQRRLRGGGVPCLASVALEQAVQVAQRFDEEARLKRLVAPLGTQADGAALRWEFGFDLPRRRAKLDCDWYLDHDARAGRFGRECFDLRAAPFPPSDSLLARGVAEGRVAYGQLAGVWRDERRLTPDLPLVFADSDVALVELQALGLRPGAQPFTLRVVAEAGAGSLWQARAGERVWHCRYA